MFPGSPRSKALTIPTPPHRRGEGVDSTARRPSTDRKVPIGTLLDSWDGEAATLPPTTTRLPSIVDRRIQRLTNSTTTGASSARRPQDSTTNAVGTRMLVPVPNSTEPTINTAAASPGDGTGWEDMLQSEWGSGGWSDTKARAKAGYQRLITQHAKQVEEKQKEIDELKERLARTATGGSQFVELQQAYSDSQGEVRKLHAKVKSLVKLLDRAGATIRLSQERGGKGKSAGIDGMGDDLLMGSHRVDWTPISAVMRDLAIRDQSDEHILGGIVRYIQKLSGQVGVLENSLESSSSKIMELEGKKETLLMSVQNHKSEIDDLRSEITHMKRSAYGGDISEVASLRQEFEADKARMLHQITSLETAMRNSVDTRPFFVAMGKAISVPPFLRYDGRVRNVGMNKKAVENLINALWVTRFEPVLARCTALKDAGVLTEHRGQGGGGVSTVKSVLDAFEKASSLSIALEKMFIMEKLANSLLSPSTSIEGGATAKVDALVDYDNLNVWEVRRGDARKFVSFHDHVARFLIEVIKPDKMPLVLYQYSKTDGLNTPPMADVARNARTTLMMCAPQQNVVMRPAAAMPVEVAEIAYSLMDGCDRFSFDADVELFRRISKGQLPESAFFDQMIMLQKLKIILNHSAVIEREQAREAAGLDNSRRGSGSFMNSSGEFDEVGIQPSSSKKATVQSVLRMLRKFFPAKTQEDFRLLQRALLLDVHAISLNSEEAMVQKGTLEGMGMVTTDQMALEVDVSLLFASNDSGNQGYFLECVRNQHLESLTTYMAEVQHAILSLCKPEAADALPPPALQPQPTLTSSSSSVLLAAPGGRSRAGSLLVRGQRGSTLSLRSQSASVLSIRDRLAEIDPIKPRSDINTHVYHLLQLMYIDRQRVNAPDADLVHQSCEDWFQPPLCHHVVNLEEISKYCPVVLAKRCGPGPVQPQGSFKQPAPTD